MSNGVENRTLLGFREIAGELARTAQAIQAATAGMQAAIKTATEGMARMPEMLRQFNQEVAYLMPWLAARSWYFGMDMPLSAMGQLARLARAGDVDTVDATLAEWQRREAQTVITRIADHFPDRRNVLTAALEAHQAGNYALSIPAFLAQADGIAHVYLAESFFRTRLWQQRLNTFMQEANLTDFSAVLVSPLSEPGLLRTPTGQLPDVAGILNRHQILHGLTSDYGSEINSLKCIGLLDYLYAVGEMILRREPEQPAGG